uniref:Molybdenum cofactor sulfurase n=1 Tax=Rhizophora mucronata TaxID=61149 RepID=A0A2P2KJB9_RHIMU
MEAAKEEFLKEFGEDYGYPNGPKSIDDIRATEFKRLDQNGIVYLDHAGATLYSELQMEAIFKDLTSSVYGNPRILLFKKKKRLFISLLQLGIMLVLLHHVSRFISLIKVLVGYIITLMGLLLLIAAGTDLGD